ncbi:MAG: peptidogalycan biosysnthesis protein [Geminicoccaceae bacterium]
MAEPPLAARTLRRIDEVAAQDWDRLVEDGNPFVRHGFLHALEARLGRCQDRLAALPSRGRGGQGAGGGGAALRQEPFLRRVCSTMPGRCLWRAGGRYYPKLQLAVPFTPVPGPRLLARDAASREGLVAALGGRDRAPGRLLAARHLLHRGRGAVPLEGHGFLIRHGVQYHWRNQGYASFADWLASLKSARRKMIKRSASRCARPASSWRPCTARRCGPACSTSSSCFYLATVEQAPGQRLSQPRFLPPPRHRAQGPGRAGGGAP